MAKRQQEDHCSFCGRGRSEVSILISGVDGHICEHCIVQAEEIMREELRANKSKHGEVKLRKPMEIKQLLDEYVIGRKKPNR